MDIGANASEGKELAVLQRTIERNLAQLEGLSESMAGSTDIESTTGSSVDGASASEMPDPQLRIQIHRLLPMLRSVAEQLEKKRELLKRYRRVFHNASDYTLVRTLAVGGFATVYLAKRKETKQFVAIKVHMQRRLNENKMR